MPAVECSFVFSTRSCFNPFYIYMLGDDYLLTNNAMSSKIVSMNSSGKITVFSAYVVYIVSYVEIPLRSAVQYCGVSCSIILL